LGDSRTLLLRHPVLAKNIGKLEPVLEREDELDALNEYIEDFKKEFEC
jgi:hypothetical protein